jgi:dTDP-glucose 4,6-dehydratase
VTPTPVGDLDSILERSRDDLEALRGTTLLVTGGTGFVGTWLLAALHRADGALGLGLRILLLSREPDRFARLHPDLAGWWHPVRGDVTAMPTIPAVDAAVHAATPASAAFNDAHPEAMRATIVDGMESLLDRLAPSGRVPLLFTSSGAVYGPQPPELVRIPETYDPPATAFDERNAYALGKRDAERIAAGRAADGQVALRLARLFAFVGPHLPLDAHFAIGNFIGDALADRPIAVSGDGTAIRSYMYASDMVVALLAVLLRGGDSVPYNVGSPDPVSIAELAVRVRDELRPDQEVLIGGAPLSALPTGAGSVYVPDISRLERDLGARAETGLDEAIRRTARWAAG